jgi:hypothetical protein
MRDVAADMACKPSNGATDELKWSFRATVAKPACSASRAVSTTACGVEAEAISPNLIGVPTLVISLSFGLAARGRPPVGDKGFHRTAD